MENQKKGLRNIYKTIQIVLNMIKIQLFFCFTTWAWADPGPRPPPPGSGAVSRPGPIKGCCGPGPAAPAAERALLPERAHGRAGGGSAAAAGAVIFLGAHPPRRERGLQRRGGLGAGGKFKSHHGSDCT